MTSPANASRYPLWGMLAALAGFLALQAVAAWHAGVFEYPLDDVYIHLAVASSIAGGGYGVNAGEPASAASSILYPFLLLPFPGTEAQRLLPLFWNVLAVAGAGWVWGLVAVAAGLAGAAGAAVAVAGPVLLNMPGVGFTGMEASLHLLASLVVVLGLWRALTGQGVAVWFLAAAIAAPLLRYEGLALSLLAAGALFLHGHRRAALAVALAVAGGVAAFSLFLVSLGLDPLPSSVLVKTAGLARTGDPVSRLLVGLVANLLTPAGALLGLLVVAVAVAMLAAPRLRRGAAGAVLAVAWAAALAHLLLGQIGWMHRYEPYAIASLLAAVLLAGSAAGPGPGVGLRALALVAIAAAGIVYMPKLWLSYTWAPRAIHLQQGQMARFAQDYLAGPVAVNDIGRVAWGNPSYVLDLWGLASAEARRARLGPAEPPAGWAGALTDRHGVRVAMIYDRWIRSGVGPSWRRVATLSLDPPHGALAGTAVAIYATDPAFVDDLRARLAAFAPTLPEGAVLTMEAGA